MKGTVRTPLLAPAAPGEDLTIVELAASGGASAGQRAKLPRAAVAVHLATLSVAFGTWMYWDRGLWFFGDEWDFLTRRGLHGASFSIWAPHNEHWSVLPILLWRGIFSLVHLSAYWPYLVPLLLVHVAICHLCWRRCLIEGAPIWLASALTLLMALFGTGAEDLAWAFQVGFLGSTAFGLLAMEAAQGPLALPEARFVQPLFSGRRFDRPAVRDGLLAVLALAALMCSDIGVAVCAGLALVVLARRGWRRALTALSVPVCVYSLWFALAGRKGLAATGDTLRLSVFLKIPTFVVTNLQMDLGHASGWPHAGYAFLTILAAWLVWRGRDLFRDHPVVLGGALTAVAFYALAAVGRDRISATMSPSRYAYVGTAFLMPAIALLLGSVPSAVQRVLVLWRAARRARVARQGLVLGAAAVSCAVLGATVANAHWGLQFVRARTPYVRGLGNQVVTSAYLLQSSAQLAHAVNYYPVWASGFAAGYLTPWELRDLYRAGYVHRPASSLMTLSQVREDESWLDLAARHAPLSSGRFVYAGNRYRVRAAARPRSPSERGARPPSLPPKGWLVGPGSCVVSTQLFSASTRGDPAESVFFAAARGARSAALWISLGPPGGRVHFYLRKAWGFEGPPGGGSVQGEIVNVPARGYFWLNDSAAQSGLGLALPAGHEAEICGLSPTKMH